MLNRICIIDDDKIYRFTTEKYIKMLKLANEVTTFSDGEEALNFLKKNTNNTEVLPDLVLLDVNMPIMDGWDFVEELAKLDPKPNKQFTLYMVTSSIDDRDRNRANSINEISDFIIKPITEKQLVELVQKALV